MKLKLKIKATQFPSNDIPQVVSDCYFYDKFLSLSKFSKRYLDDTECYPSCT